MKRFAFPLLDALDRTKSHVTEISRGVLPRVADVLASRSSTRGPQAYTTSISDQEGLSCVMMVGREVAIPMTFVGSCHDKDDEVLVHTPGLAGAFPIEVSALSACRGQFVFCSGTSQQSSSSSMPSEEAQQLGTVCALEALRHGFSNVDVLDRMYRVARRRHFSVLGTESLLTHGEQINEKALALTFPYHCGGVQATKRYYDTSEAVCQHFPPSAAHGTKVLSRYGVAVCVGVSVDESLRVPCVYWHPAGAPAACLAPTLHGSRVLPVGHVALQYNGPTAACEVLSTEDVRRYMNTAGGDDNEDCVDQSAWLCEGLFGVRAGAQWGGASTEVVGVVYSKASGELELAVRDTASGAVSFADDIADGTNST